MGKHSQKGMSGGGLGDCTVWVGAKDSYGYGKKKVTWQSFLVAGLLLVFLIYLIQF